MGTLSLPRFKQPSRAKTKEWADEVLLYAGSSLSLYTTSSVRSAVRDKLINLDLYNSVIHVEDFVQLVNPLNLSTINSTREITHYPIAAPLIDLQVGELINGSYEPVIQIINNIAIDDKQERLQAYAKDRMKDIEREFKGDKESLKTAIEDLQRELRYTYKDIKEKKASALLNHYMTELDIKGSSVEAYRRMHHTGEELYEIDVVNNEPTFRVVNTVKLRTYGGGNSSKIHDADIIVIEDHFSAGYLIDRYGSQLTEDEVDRILSFETGFGIYDKPYGDVTHEYTGSEGSDILGEELSSNYVDANSNIRHLRVRWKAYKEVKKVKYQDPVTGEEVIKVVSDTYRLQEGESLHEKVWIYDWWIGTLIGADMTVDAHPIPIRYNRMSNLSEGHPGVVGRTFNLNERTAVPPMTRMRPYQYLYDVIIDNMITAMSKNIGPILEMDLARRPANWDTTKWLSFMTKYNTKFVDNFKEITKGSATGQIAGNMAAGKDQVMNLDFGNYIQQLVNMAEYLKSAMAEIVGIVPQRLGAVSNRETVGGVERATSQSSHMTEWLNYIHESNLTEALNVFLEAANFALKDNPKKLQTMVDGFTREMLEVTEEDFVGIDFGVFVSNSTKAKEHKQILEQAAHAYMQNGGEFSFVFDILFSESMSEKRKLIEEHEDRARESAAEQQKADQAQFKEQTAQIQKQEDTKIKIESRKVELDKYKADLDAKIKIALKKMELAQADKESKIGAEQSQADLELNMTQLQQEIDSEYSRSKEKQQELNLKDKELGIKEKEVAQKAQVQQPAAQ